MLKRKQEIYSGGHFCTNCGAFMDDDMRYCGECGGIITKQAFEKAQKIRKSTEGLSPAVKMGGWSHIKGNFS